MAGADTPPRPTRATLLRWLGWFGLINACLCAVVGLRYLLAFGPPASALAWVYLATASIGQFALLGILPVFLLVFPLVVLAPGKRLTMTVAVLLAALVLSLVVLDTNIFAQYKYHLSRLTMEIFDTSTWVFAGTLVILLTLFQSLIATNVWQRIAVGSGKSRSGVWIGLVIFFIWLTGQGIHIWADATAYSPVTSFNRFLPAYYPIKAKRRLARLGWVDPVVVEQQRLLRKAGVGIDAGNSAGQLRYPVNALRCEAPDQVLPDILFILVDALRPDKISVQHTPHIAQFAAQSQNFSNHYSGGNSSRMGIFSMFYGLPSTYWQSFYELQRQPVLMSQLLENDYQMAAFSSVGFGSPAQIDRTLFAAADMAMMWTPEFSEADKNSAITTQWMRWLDAERNMARPFFGFLYYDPGNLAADNEKPVLATQGVEQLYTQYLEGIAGVDANLAELLQDLRVRQGERPTMIIIASDHGYEFDELGLGYVGHASNYGRYQLRSTLLIDWPGRQPQLHTHRSAHQDLPGTLLQDLLGCENPVRDYSSGGNLFAATDWEWFIAGSYNSHAIIEPEQLIVTYPGGMIDLLDVNYRPDPDLKLDANRVEQALLEMRRFYR